LKYFAITASLLFIILNPYKSFCNDKDYFLEKIEDLNKSYRSFVFSDNENLTILMNNCNSYFFVDNKCVNIISKIKDLTFKILVETDSITTLYKTFVYGNECLNYDLKMNLYSSIYHARNEYSLMQLDLEILCSDNKEEFYMSERCKKEGQFNNKFVEITDYIFESMNHHIDLTER
jgi:hypothetical protein